MWAALAIASVVLVSVVAWCDVAEGRTGIYRRRVGLIWRVARRRDDTVRFFFSRLPLVWRTELPK